MQGNQTRNDQKWLKHDVVFVNLIDEHLMLLGDLMEKEYACKVSCGHYGVIYFDNARWQIVKVTLLEGRKTLLKA